MLSPRLFDFYLDGVLKEFEIRVVGESVRLIENGREWRLLRLFYVRGVNELFCVADLKKVRES